MEVSSKDIASLKRLQEIDVAATTAQRELNDLPQAKMLKEIRQKLSGILQKQEQVNRLADTNRTDLSRVGAEIEILSIRQEETQKKIDEAGSDFRAIDSLTKDMAGMAERTQELDANRKSILAREEQIEGVKKQIDTALSALSAQEAGVSKELQEKVAVLQEKIDQANQEHQTIIATVPADVAKEYERARKHCGGVALSVLVEGQCSTCRSTLDETRLLQVRHQAPLGVCPMCHRLMFVQ